jgi:hypothetical protein
VPVAVPDRPSTVTGVGPTLRYTDRKDRRSRQRKDAQRRDELSRRFDHDLRLACRDFVVATGWVSHRYLAQPGARDDRGTKWEVVGEDLQNQFEAVETSLVSDQFVAPRPVVDAARTLNMQHVEYAYSLIRLEAALTDGAGINREQLDLDSKKKAYSEARRAFARSVRETLVIDPD